MPRPETKYYCDICNEGWNKKDMAIECEKSHLIIAGIGKPYYNKDEKKECPASVLVNFEGGKSARYYRKEGL